MNYEDFFSAADVATFKRVKRGQMMLGSLGREVAAGIVGGTISATGKEFVTTRRGLYRLASRANSDNTTERYAHAEMGATTVVMGDDDDLDAFFREHGVRDGLAKFRRSVKARLG